MRRRHGLETGVLVASEWNMISDLDMHTVYVCAVPYRRRFFSWYVFLLGMEFI